LNSEVRDNSHSTGYSLAYSYDHNANRLTKVVGTGGGAVTTTNTYGTHDQLLTSGSKSYGYDSNGNCTSVTVGSSVTSLTYDYENRVTSITYPSSATNSFTYNGNDLRMQKVDSAGTANYLCDGTTPASSVLKDGSAVYTPGLSERRGSASKFYHGDALGSTRGITNTSQTVTDSVLYDGFGMTVSRTGTTPTPFGFVGSGQYQTDNDSGLMLLGHRYYDAGAGRFISSDPAKAGNNWYAYCNNNPLQRTDPLGLDWVDDAANFSAGWGDTLTGGLTQVVRIAIGVDGQVDPNSPWYHGGEVVGTIHAIALQRGKGRCFVTGTPVQMADGSTKPIEEVKKGDQVLSSDPPDDDLTVSDKAKHSRSVISKAQASAKAVVRTFVNHSPTLNLTVEGRESVTTTAAHPFYVEGRGFVKAGALALGNAIVTRAGPAVKINGIRYTGKTETVHNFEVEDYHTYFVGKINGGMWVHNQCPASPGRPAPSNPPSSGPTKPPTRGGPPDSVYTHTDQNGKALQNAIYDNHGNVIGYVDFKNHGGATSGHYHEFPVPGDPSSGHGPGAPHFPHNTLPPRWGHLPPGIPPHTPIGK
jgi:RHS repeat-associated protein